MNDEKLIECVRNYTVLYDLSHKRYMGIQYKNIMWVKVGEEMEMSASLCKSRWSSIRDNYRRSLRKQKTVSGQKATAVRPYKYSEQLGFLHKTFEERETVSSVETVMPYANNLSQEDEQFIATDGCITEVGDIEEAEEPETSTVYRKRKNTEESSGSGKRKKVGESPESSALGLFMEHLIRTEENNAVQEQDPVDIFFKAMASAMKKLPFEYFHRAKAGIFSIVHELEAQYILAQKRNASNYVDPVEVQGMDTQ